MSSDIYDDLVIGAGSSGSVIASRLSEDADRRVLLLETGPCYAGIGQTPAELLDASVVAFGSHNWCHQAFLRDEPGRAQPSDANLFEYRVGKVAGGSSAINAAMALRGLPEDYDEWARLSGGAWSWADVLPVFAAIECDPAGDLAWHGHSGPIPIHRESADDLAPLQAAFLHACKARGHAEVEDHNHPQAMGVGIVPKNMQGGHRMSTALTHLAAARGRQNLHLVPGAQVLRLTWRGPATCDGAHVLVDGRPRHYRARRVVLCAGALHTPVLLLRSGIGDPAQLEPLGIEVHAPLAGVGANLLEHPTVAVWFVPKPGRSRIGEPAHQVMLRYTSQAGTSRGDMQMYMLGGIDATQIPMLHEALGSPIGAAVSACLMKSVSRGRVSLQSAHPEVPPRVVMNCIAEREDAERLEEGARLAWQLLQRPELEPYVERVFAWNDRIVASGALLQRSVAALTRTMQHPVGTARMGRASDPAAVVEPGGRVHGIDNVWVADASVMPSMPSSPTHLSCVMVAEKIAAELRRDDEVMVL